MAGITGMENTYKALLSTKIGKAITASTGTAPASPNNIGDLALGIAQATISFLTANAVVTIPPGSIVTAGSPSTQTGPAAPVLLQIS